MNVYIDRLSKIAQKKHRLIIGLMSGTSLDGLDIALCRISGSGRNSRVALENYVTIPYEDSFRAELKKVFSKPVVDFQLLCVLNPYIGRLHARLILETLENWKLPPDEIDLIASHGQTVYHAPRTVHPSDGYPDATLQIGDGDHIAVQTGIITISDFRQKHIAAGGEGAPLAVYGDYILFTSSSENRILLNLGGIANFTFLPDTGNPDEVFTSDVGPANTLLDAYCREHLGCLFDEGGAIAQSGKKNEMLLRTLLDNEFFRRPLPGSTGPELFNLDYLSTAQKRSDTEKLRHEDVLATLAHFTARAVTDSILKYVPPERASTVYVSGGGANNPFLLNLIGQQLGKITLRPLIDLGVPGDAKEAILFALLANETVAARNPSLTIGKDIPGISLGKISLPG